MEKEVNINHLPIHIAIIMDGNGRWAKSQGKPRVFGHEKGVEAVRKTIEASAKLGIKYLTLYTFSTENFNRPKLEVQALMGLLSKGLQKEIEKLHKSNIRFNVIGDLTNFPDSVKKDLISSIEKTKNNSGLCLTLALGYGSQKEISEAVKSIAQAVKNNEIKVEDIDNQTISNHLYTKNIPDVDLLIRTSGEYRISNFLLWQIAYAELYFTDIFWPDFGEEELEKAIKSYQKRERRFGKTSEQLVE